MQALNQNDTKALRIPAQGPYTGETYYEIPALKPAHYGWLIVSYFFIGGLASASQFLAAVVDLFGKKEDRPLVRHGRYLAFLGALVSPFLLIFDLFTPQRWYNMMRIYRGTSPMSIGTWALTTFGVFSGFAAVGQALEDLWGWAVGRWLARLAGLPAALAGGVVAMYTGTLLTATSSPLWASGFPFLSSFFASSAASTAAAALTLTASARPRTTTARRGLTWFALVSGMAELAFALLARRNFQRERVARPLEEQPVRTAWWYGVFGLGILAPLVLHAVELVSGRESRRLSSAASVMTLAGGLLLRAAMVFGGKRSSVRPRDYFRLAQPENIGQIEGSGSFLPGR